MLFSEHNYKLVFPGSTFNNPNHVITFITPLITVRGHSTSAPASPTQMQQLLNLHKQVLSHTTSDNLTHPRLGRNHRSSSGDENIRENDEYGNG